MIKEAIEKAARGIDLTEKEAYDVFDEVMSGKATSAEIGALITALRTKGETVDEITGAAKVMREKSVRIDIGEAIVDTCGTGGTGTNTFNISTTVAFVVAGCGIKVAKHGNKGASSACGSADVLDALGVKLSVEPDVVRKCITEIGIGFLYAPSFHNAMKHAATPRKEVGGRTIFNVLGPLSNPANVGSQLIGVYDAGLTEIIAGVLKNLGSERAFVVHGMDNLDEITITGETKVTELKDGKINTYYITPEKFGMKRATLRDIEGGDAKKNAAIVMDILKGESGPKRDIVLLNAGAALVSASKAKDLLAGIKMAAESIDSGKALDKLLKLIELTNR